MGRRRSDRFSFFFSSQKIAAFVGGRGRKILSDAKFLFPDLRARDLLFFFPGSKKFFSRGKLKCFEFALRNGSREETLRGNISSCSLVFFCDSSSSYVHTFPPWAECNQFQFLFPNAALAFPFFIQAFLFLCIGKEMGVCARGQEARNIIPKPV